MSSGQSSEVVDLETLSRRLEAHSSRMEALEEEIERVQEERDEEREKRKRAEAERDAAIEDIRDRIAELDARTDILQLVNNSDEMEPKQRSIALLQNLRQDALRKEGDGRRAVASLTRSQAERALHFPDQDRTTFYTDMRRAARLVGDDDVLWYDDDGDVELKLNLEKGSLPDAIDGHAITECG